MDSYIYDILIKDTLIIDGLGRAGFVSDLGIKDGMIKKIGKLNREANIIIEGSKLIACPGFIDTHSHIDLSMIDNLNADSFIMQGITSAVGGNCGVSMAPILDEDFFQSYLPDIISKSFDRKWTDFNEWLEYLETNGTGVNYIPLVGHHLLRGGILGKKYNRVSTQEEISKIILELEKALDEGAFGMSMGLDGGFPGRYADSKEVLSLLNVIRNRGDLFTAHTRHVQNEVRSENGKPAYGLYIGEQGEVITGRYHGFIEILEYAEKVRGLNLLISHLMSPYLVPQPHPKYLDDAIAKATLEEIIDKPRSKGINVTFNVVFSDYSIGSEQYILDSFFNKSLAIPEWIKKMGKDEFRKILKDRDFRKEIKELANSGKLKFGILSPACDPYWSQCYRITESSNENYIGKTIFEIAKEKCSDYINITRVIYDCAIDVTLDIIEEYPEAKWAMMWDKRTSEIYKILLTHPFGMPCTDSPSYAANPDRSKGSNVFFSYGISPIAYNAMPSYLIKMVKEEKFLTIEEAIRKLTSLPANIFGIPLRGVIKEGYWADIVLIDWDSIKVNDNFLSPETPPEGIEYVIVNGKIAYQNRELTGLRNGKVLRKK